jgi:hypothetical protein
MAKTRRKLYGKGRRRRQKGGGSRWWVLLGAVAALKGALADEPGFRQLVSDWWNSDSILASARNSKALADYLTGTPRGVPKVDIPAELFEPKEDAVVYTAPPPEQKEKVEEVVEPYLNTTAPTPSAPTVKATELKNGKTYMYNGEPIEVDTWSNRGDTIAISVVGESEPLIVPANATFEAVPEPPEEEEEKEGGRKRRKTLRKKK